MTRTKSRLRPQVMDFVSPASEASSTSSGPECRFVDQDRATSLLQGFSALYDQKQFTDITLCIEDEEFPCHRNVLAISSPFFMGMFSNDLVESRQGRIQINEMDARTLESILDYIYTGEVMLSEEVVQNVLSAANLFQLIQLRNGCAEYMIKHVSVSNCIGIYFFAKAHQCELLAEKAKEILNSQFTSLCKESEFLSLPPDNLIEIVQDDKLNVSSEEMVYEACLAWLNYNMEERKPSLTAVFRCVRFANISSYYFCDKIDPNPLFLSGSEIRKILDAVKYYQMLKNRQTEVDLNFLPRKGMSYMRGIVILANPYNEDSAKKLNTMELLWPKAGEMKHMCKLPQSVYMPGTCISGQNQIFLAGGAIRKINYRGPWHEGVSSSLYLFDQNFGSWQVKSKMHYGRSQFALVMVDGALFAVGGQNETDIMDSVEKYDTIQNHWSLVSPLPQRLRCVTGVSYRGHLYIFGGETCSEITNTCYRYDPSENSWLELPSFHTPRALAGSVVYKDKIYIIGGNSLISPKWRKEFLPEHTVSSVEIFDPATGEWSVGPELPNALCGPGVVKYGGSIMVVGGEDDKSWMAGLFILKKEEGKEFWVEGKEEGKEFWVEGKELPSVMSTFGCVVANIPKDLIKDKEDYR